MNDHAEQQDQPTQPNISESHRATTQEPPPRKRFRQADNQGDNRSNWRELREWARFLIEILTLGAVVWYATIAYRQWNEAIRSNALTQQTLNEAKRSNEAAQRPWLVITAKGAQRFRLGDKRLELRIDNAGKGPAQQIRSITESMPGKGDMFPDSPPFRKPTIPGSLGVLGPDRTYVLYITVTSLNPTQMKDIEVGNLQLFFYGRLTYTDQFSSDRETQWCFVYNRHTQGLSPCYGYNRLR